MLRLLAAGHSNQAIAKELVVAVGTGKREVRPARPLRGFLHRTQNQPLNTSFGTCVHTGLRRILAP